MGIRTIRVILLCACLLMLCLSCGGAESHSDNSVSIVQGGDSSVDCLDADTSEICPMGSRPELLADQTSEVESCDGERCIVASLGCYFSCEALIECNEGETAIFSSSATQTTVECR